MTGDTDLFGHTPAQGSLFGEGEDRIRRRAPAAHHHVPTRHSARPAGVGRGRRRRAPAL